MNAPAPLPPAPSWEVICLCADWCGTCREWRPLFEQLARAHPGVRFAWVDIEDEADAVGELDIETFPTVLIASAGRPRFFGPVLPHTGHVDRLLASLRDDGQGAAQAPETLALLKRLHTIKLQLI
jgi:thioredoxin 1